ncbi:MAG: lamin tail domain-containing protein, partial [Planctomycetota bacterium]
MRFLSGRFWRRSGVGRRARLRLEPLEPRVLLSGHPLISEFMAINDSVLADEDGDYSDWVEVCNPGTEAIDLSQWGLTDDKGDTEPWTFPAVELAGGQHLVVFASDKDRAVAGGELHTDFKLSGDGEYLGLVSADGSTVASAFDPFPAQEEDVSYGFEVDEATRTLIAPGAAARTLVPTDGALGLSWTATEFDDGGWRSGPTGVGYERGTGYESLLQTDIGAEMFDTNGSAYIRIPFSVEPGAAFSSLTLRMKYDDGFVAYLNGEPLPGRNAPEAPQWNALATT